MPQPPPPLSSGMDKALEGSGVPCASSLLWVHRFCTGVEMRCPPPPPGRNAGRLQVHCLGVV
jgi:hypothetical protein